MALTRRLSSFNGEVKPATTNQQTGETSRKEKAINVNKRLKTCLKMLKGRYGKQKKRRILAWWLEKAAGLMFLGKEQL